MSQAMLAVWVWVVVDSTNCPCFMKRVRCVLGTRESILSVEYPRPEVSGDAENPMSRDGVKEL